MKENMKKNFYYKILGVKINATQEEITKAYKKMATVFHPDSGVQNDEMFKMISDAYDTLKDPEKRKQYDWEQENNTYDYKDPYNYKLAEYICFVMMLPLLHGVIGAIIGGIIGFIWLMDFDIPVISLFSVFGLNIGLLRIKLSTAYLVFAFVVLMIVSSLKISHWIQAAVLFLITVPLPVILILREIPNLKKIVGLKMKKNIEKVSAVFILVVVCVFSISLFADAYQVDQNDKLKAEQSAIAAEYFSNASMRNVPSGVDLSKNVIKDGYGISTDDIIVFNVSEKAIVDKKKETVMVPVYMELVRIYKNEEWDPIAEKYYLPNPPRDANYDYYHIQYVLQKNPEMVEKYSLDEMVSFHPEVQIIAPKVVYYLEDGTRLNETIENRKYENANDGLLTIRVPKEFLDYAIEVRGSEIEAFSPKAGWIGNEILK